jgi:transaldolase
MEVNMNVFLDTANISEIREAVSYGIICGVTTNPSILAREGGGNWQDRIQEILGIVEGDVFAEVLSPSVEGMVREAEEMATWSSRMVIKIPMIPEGVKAMYHLSKKNIPTAATLVFSPVQAIIASLAGVKYVASFVGRAFEVNMDGVKNIEDITAVFHKQKVSTQILAASVRNAQDAMRVFLAGADCITASFSVIKQMMNHPMSDLTLKKFMEDWSKT